MHQLYAALYGDVWGTANNPTLNMSTAKAMNVHCMWHKTPNRAPFSKNVTKKRKWVEKILRMAIILCDLERSELKR